MSLVDLPAAPFPVPATISWMLMDFGGTMQGSLGGSAQRVNRLGGRWKVSFRLPRMTFDDANLWQARCNRGLRLGVRWPIIPRFSLDQEGAPRIAGAEQAGTTLAIDGVARNYLLRNNQPIAVITDGRRYVYKMAEPLRVGADGTGMLEIEPPLRIEHGDNDVVEIAAPFLEGLLAEPLGGDFEVDQFMSGMQLTIVEAR